MARLYNTIRKEGLKRDVLLHRPYGSYTDPTGTVVGFLCRRFRTTLPAFYSGEYAQPHFLLIARETLVMEFSFCCQFTSFYSFVNEIQKQFTLNSS